MTQSPHIFTDTKTGMKVRAFMFPKEEAWQDGGDSVVTIPLSMDTVEMTRPTDVTGLWCKDEFGKRFK